MTRIATAVVIAMASAIGAAPATSAQASATNRQAPAPAGEVRPLHRPGASPSAVVDDIRVHGNHSTPDAEVLRIAGLAAGQPVSAAAIDAARERLERSGRFARVEIRLRSRSIADDGSGPSAIVILVAEHAAVRPVGVGIPRVPGPIERLRSQVMFLPILGVEDGYGLTYGLRTSLVGGPGSTMRVSMPASWGGTRQLALEVERTFVPGGAGDRPDADGHDEAPRVARGPVTRVRGSVGLWRQEHPYFDRGQFRQYADAEVGIRPRAGVGVGVTGSVAAVHFGDVDDRMTSVGAFAELDTRRDPLFPRNAVYARTTWRRVGFAHPERSGVPDGARLRWRHDVRGYAGLIGQVVLAARVQVETSDGPLPAYAMPLVGGADTLRGLRAGFGVGDNMWAASVEARVPVTSVLRTTRIGVLAFHDVGVTWNHGERWRDRSPERGVGVGVFLINPFVRLQVSVARGLDHGTRVHASTGIGF